jgi:hypothetical protein
MRQTSMVIRAVANFIHEPRESIGSWLVESIVDSTNETVATADTDDPAKAKAEQQRGHSGQGLPASGGGTGLPCFFRTAV